MHYFHFATSAAYCCQGLQPSFIAALLVVKKIQKAFSAKESFVQLYETNIRCSFRAQRCSVEK